MILIVAHIRIEAAVYGVKLGEVGIGFEAAAGVYRHDIELFFQFIVVNRA